MAGETTIVGSNEKIENQMQQMEATTTTTTNGQRQRQTNAAASLITANKKVHARKAIKIGKSIDEYELRRLPTVIRSKYSFYLEPAHNISEAQKDSQKRLQELINNQLLEKQRQLEKMNGSKVIKDLNDMKNNVNGVGGGGGKKRSTKAYRKALREAEELIRLEKERHERLIGQLKAAEAANRTRILKMRYINLKKDEIENLIESQSSALSAVRLEAFLPSPSDEIIFEAREKRANESLLNQIEKRRVDALVDDSTNIFIARKLH